MNHQKRLRYGVGLATLFVAQLMATDAFAYNWDAHSKIVETAVKIMQYVPESWSATPPAGVEPTDWQLYLDQVRAAPAKLVKLQLGTLNRGDPDNVNPADDDPTICHYDPRDDLTRVEYLRIEDFSYYLNRSDNPCAMVHASPLANECVYPITDEARDAVLGSVLGWHSGMVDDHVDDTVLWGRPTNALFNSGAKEAIDEVANNSMAALLVPVVCLIKWFSGDDCDWEDAMDAADKVNPDTLVEGWLPGIGDIRSSDYTGVWHFVRPEAAGNGRYNTVPGLFYEDAGPGGVPGVLDLGITAAADGLGLSLNGYSADGVSRYGKYDEHGRWISQWQKHTIGHVEFSPLQNLARYGFDRYVANPTRASDLGWPLHAIADATVPQHVAGTTSYGHRPYEDAIGNNWSQMVLHVGSGGVGPTSDALDAAQVERILVEGYYRWQMLRQGVSLKDYIVALASDTRGYSEVGRWPFDDWASFQYQFGDRAASLQAYASKVEPMRFLVESGIGATVSFLIQASGSAVDPGKVEGRCPSGRYFSGAAHACVDGAPPPCGASDPMPGGVCNNGGTCQDPGGPSCVPNGGTCIIDDDPAGHLPCCSPYTCSVAVGTGYCHEKVY